MVLDLQREKELLYTKFLTEKRITSKTVLKAFLTVPREAFLPSHLKSYAYDDTPLPIGAGQTISQPTTVLLMTQWLKVKAGQKILEIGTGSGYQAAILSKLVGKKGKIVTIETMKELVEKAQIALRPYSNVQVIFGDGSGGYLPEAPYDRIIITAAAPEKPLHLLSQLKRNGLMLVPVGKKGEQQMLRIAKNGKIENLGVFVFVPLMGKYGM